MSSPIRRRSIGSMSRDDVVQVEHLGLEHLPAAEREQLAGERAARSAARGSPRLSRGGVGRSGALEQQLAVAADHGEQVVEVVGDPAGEPADRLELLRLPQLLLECLALGDVAADRFGAAALPSSSIRRLETSTWIWPPSPRAARAGTRSSRTLSSFCDACLLRGARATRAASGQEEACRGAPLGCSRGRGNALFTFVSRTRDPRSRSGRSRSRTDRGSELLRRNLLGLHALGHVQCHDDSGRTGPRSDGRAW